MNEEKLPRRFEPDIVEEKLHDLDELALEISQLHDPVLEQLEELERCLERYPDDLPAAAKAVARSLRDYQQLADAVAGLNDNWQTIGRYEGPRL